MENKARYLTPNAYMADPHAHVFEGQLYIYPSHDIDAGIAENDNGDHFDMQDYHVYSLDRIDADAVDHGVALCVDDVPWAQRQLWDCDCAQKGDNYYLYFPAKDYAGRFRIGVAVSSAPWGPFVAQAAPIAGSYSIDPCVFNDKGAYYMYFGGLWGGQLERYRENSWVGPGGESAPIDPALPPRVAKLSDDMLQFAHAPRPVLLQDEHGILLTAGDHQRRFFEASWMHQYRGRYYFSYSTGNTHQICYAIGDNPYGPFTYQGVILTPVVGWTTHHSIAVFKGQWYLFFHDAVPSGGKTWLRSMKMCPLNHRADGRIETVDGGGPSATEAAS